MGDLFLLSCSECGYSKHLSLGCGMFYFFTYDNTVQAAKDGTYGETYRTFFREHPDGAINAEHVIMKCDSCGEYDDPKDLSLYVPKGNMDIPEKVKRCPWLWDLIRYYKKVIQFQHVCKRCGGKLHIFRTDETKDDDEPPVYVRSENGVRPDGHKSDASISQHPQPFICPNCKKALTVRLGNFD